MRTLPLVLLAACGAEPVDCPACPASEPCDEVGLDALEPPVPGGKQLAKRADALEWGACPGPLAELDCQLAALEGSPRESGRLFSIRLQAGEPFFLAPHTHPANERVTILSGALQVGFGADVDKAVGTRFGPGDYYVNAANEVHWVRSEGPVEVQITGVGPWKTEPAGE